MRRILENLALFAILTVAFSGLTGCSGSGDANVTSTDPQQNSQPSSSRSSEYPPLASSLAQLDLELLDGTNFKIADHKGKVLLLNIWGTWCGPCRAEMPHLIELKENYGDKGFEVIGINIGDGDGQPEPIELIEPFVERMKLNYVVTQSSYQSMMEFYKITKQNAVPQSFIIDREGHLRGVFIGGGPKVIDSMKQNVSKTMAEG